MVVRPLVQEIVAVHVLVHRYNHVKIVLAPARPHVKGGVAQPVQLDASPHAKTVVKGLVVHRVLEIVILDVKKVVIMGAKGLVVQAARDLVILAAREPVKALVRVHVKVIVLVHAQALVRILVKALVTTGVIPIAWDPV